MKAFTLSDLKKSKVAEINADLIRELETPKKKNKFGAKRMVAEIDGKEVKFDSKKEYTRYMELRQWEKLGIISNLQRQVTFDLGVCKYIADAVYLTDTGEKIVEDTKSSHTRKLPVYRLKYKLMKERHNITIKET